MHAALHRATSKVAVRTHGSKPLQRHAPLAKGTEWLSATWDPLVVVPPAAPCIASVSQQQNFVEQR